MKKKKDKKTESIRVDNEILSKVREHHKKTFIPIGKFYDMAAIEKLKDEVVKNKKLK